MTLEQHLSNIKDKDDQYTNVEQLRHNIETEAKEKFREAETCLQASFSPVASGDIERED